MQNYFFNDSSSEDSNEWKIEQQQMKLLNNSRNFSKSYDIRNHFNVKKSYLNVGGGLQNVIQEENIDNDGNLDTDRQSFANIQINENVKSKIFPQKKEKNCLTF